MNLTKNFTLEEMTRSDIAIKYGIKNIPNKAEIENLKIVCEGLEIIRRAAGLPIIVTSGFRCLELNKNKEVGGSETSQHLDGQAADINIPGMAVEELFQLIKMLVRQGNINVDQCIQEKNRWVHCSFRYKNNRNEFLRAVKSKGKTMYMKD